MKPLEIINEYPPNIEDIKKVFNLEGYKPIFCYGDKLYNPHEAVIIPDMLAHEEVHRIQQNGHPKEWWEQYLSDREFRLRMETEAYAHQYLYLKKVTKAKIYNKFLSQFAGLLASTLYGELLTEKQAETKLRLRAKELSLNVI